MENEVRAKEGSDLWGPSQSSRYMALAKMLTSKCRGKPVSVNPEPCASAPKSRELWFNCLFPSIYGKQLNVASPDSHKSWERVEKRWEGGKFLPCCQLSPDHCVDLSPLFLLCSLPSQS